jgi:hypothetical protein
MKALRTALGIVGVVLVAVGVRNLLDEDRADLLNAVIWLGGGVLAHDLLLAPATLVVVAVTISFLPRWMRKPATVGFVVLATVTVAAIPVLGRFGARIDNPTLLDRNYVGGWLLLAATVLAAVAVGAALGRRHSRGEG